MNSPSDTSPVRSIFITGGIFLIAALILRFGTDVAHLPPTWDEPLMQPVVAALVDEGWTVETAIDYEDTKGPVFFWTYAVLGEVFGADVKALRLMTLAMLSLTAIPLGLIAARCGLGGRATAALAVLYVLLPYWAVLGELFMSEASFLLGSLLLLLAFLWGFGDDTATERRVAGPIVFGLLLALLLHHRPHAVAYAGAAVLVATARDGVRSWPWWAACAAAGLLRLPLFLRWGGLVSPDYQERMGLGVRLDSLTYVAIALAPITVVMIWPALRDAAHRSRRWWIGLGAVVGLLLGLIAVPDLSLTIDNGHARYMGIVASALRPLAPEPLLRIAIAVLATLGVAAIASVLVVTMDGATDERPGPLAVVHRLAGWSLLVGWVMYGITRGAVFDRYVLPFVVLLPIVMVVRVPRWLLLVQCVVLAGILVKLAATWLLVS